MEGKTELESLRQEHPVWEIGVSFGAYYARWLGSSPPIRVTAPTVEKLGARIGLAEATWYRTYSWHAVDDAIKGD